MPDDKTDDATLWHTFAVPGQCRWGHGVDTPTTRVVEWPEGSTELLFPELGKRGRTYTCPADAAKIEAFQRSLGIEVVVREVGAGQW